MNFSEIIGQNHIKSHLKKATDNGRIPHAQLFVGKTGAGTLPIALAYAKMLLCSNHELDSPSYLSCEQKVDKLTHPDLHFVYPVNVNDRVKKNAVSSAFSNEWRQFVNNNVYGSLFDWYQEIGIEKKQGNINVKEAEEMLKKLSLKAYEGGFKIMIVWHADKMNTECSNKILKLLEEPPEKTVFLLLTEDDEQLLSTISSRCQKISFPSLSEMEISEHLESKYDFSRGKAISISKQAQGDLNKALHIMSQDGDELVFEKWFVEWVRTAFVANSKDRVKGKKAIQNLLLWSEKISTKGREPQKKFLSYCVEVFRQGLLNNYSSQQLSFMETHDKTFSIEKFAPYVHQNNIFEIIEALEEASYHVERNGSAKLIFTDLSIKLTRLIHKKEYA